MCGSIRFRRFCCLSVYKEESEMYLFFISASMMVGEQK